MADDHRTLKVSCICIRPLCASHVRSGDRKVLDVEFFRFAEDKVPAGAILHEKAKAPVKAEPVKEEKPEPEKVETKAKKTPANKARKAGSNK